MKTNQMFWLTTAATLVFAVEVTYAWLDTRWTLAIISSCVLFLFLSFSIYFLVRMIKEARR